VVDFGQKLNFGVLEGIILIEIQMNDEFATEKGSSFGSVNGDVPVPEIIISDKGD
jgi:hypothetical protein